MSDIKTENRLVDTHTHITPNVDDGANSPEMSLEMLRSEAEQGGSAVILTPHRKGADYIREHCRPEYAKDVLWRNAEKLLLN